MSSSSTSLFSPEHDSQPADCIGSSSVAVVSSWACCLPGPVVILLNRVNGSGRTREDDCSIAGKNDVNRINTKTQAVAVCMLNTNAAGEQSWANYYGIADEPLCFFIW